MLNPAVMPCLMASEIIADMSGAPEGEAWNPCAAGTVEAKGTSEARLAPP